MPFTDSISMVDVIITEKTQLTATPNDVVAGKQFIGSTQHLESGTLQTNPVRTDVTIVAGESYNIPNGVNPVSYNVIAKGLPEETPGTATPVDILDTKTAWVNGEKLTGNMVNVGKEEETLLAGASHQITRGFHDGTGVITAKSLFDQTKASVVAADVLTGSDCWANGEHIAGSMTNNGKVSVSLGAGESYTVPVGYHNGQGTVTAKTLASQTVGSATAGEIVQGKTAWVNGVQLTGTITSNPAEEIILPMNGVYNIPNGYHTGLGTVTQNIPTKPAQTVGPTKNAQTIALAGYYMEGDITVTGVDALNYQRPNTTVKDSGGTDISNYSLQITDNAASVVVYADNWHDNATLNVYKLSFTGFDASSVSNSFTMMLMFDYADATAKTYSANGITITTSLEDGTNAHKIAFSNISGECKITMVEPFSAREFGVS